MFNFNVYLSKAGKVTGIIISIAMIIIGILLLALPISTVVVLEYIFAAILLVFGVFKLVEFCKASAKNPMSLLLAIITIILGVLLLCLQAESMFLVCAFLMGFIMIISAVDRFCACPGLKAAGLPIAPAIVSGIISITLAIFLLATPLVTTWVFTIFFGIFLLVDGIVYLINFCSTKTIPEEKK